MRTRTERADKVRDTYFDLVQRFPLRPLRSERDLIQATKVIDELIDREDLDPDEDDYLDVLSDLVAKFEDKHHSIPRASDAEVLSFLIEQRGVNQRTVALATEIPVSTICEIMAGKRQVSRPNIGKLARYFHVSPAVFTFEK